MAGSPLHGAEPAPEPEIDLTAPLPGEPVEEPATFPAGRQFRREGLEGIEEEAAPAPFVDAAPRQAPPSFHVLATAVVAATFDDNIYIQPHGQSDFITTLAPSLYAGWGDLQGLLLHGAANAVSRYRPGSDPRTFLYAGYTPRVDIFASHTGETSLNHDLFARGEQTWGKTTLGFEARFRTLSEPDLDVGTRTDRRILSGSLSGRVALSPKSSIDTALAVEARDYQQGLDSIETLLTAFYDRHPLPKTHVAVGAGLGYLAPDGESGQLYEQLLLRLAWQPSERLYVSLTAGGEVREFLGTGRRQVHPVFDLEVSYRLAESRELSLLASRHTSISVSQQNANLELTTVDLRFRQTLFQKIYLSLTGGYQHAEYSAVAGNADVGRTDDYFHAGASVGYEIAPWVVAELSYEYQHNASSLDLRRFARNLTELKIDLHF